MLGMPLPPGPGPRRPGEARVPTAARHASARPEGPAPSRNPGRQAGWLPSATGGSAPFSRSLRAVAGWRR
jgi:hypothetical protein